MSHTWQNHASLTSQIWSIHGGMRELPLGTVWAFPVSSTNALPWNVSLHHLDTFIISNNNVLNEINLANIFSRKTCSGYDQKPNILNESNELISYIVCIFFHVNLLNLLLKNHFRSLWQHGRNPGIRKLGIYNWHLDHKIS